MLRTVIVAMLLLAAGTSPAQAADPASAAALRLPRPDHVVIVVEENRAYSRIIGNAAAPYINALASRGALFTQSFGITHPSQPNYLALFSGSTHGIDSNACPHSLSGDNLASLLARAGLTFRMYSESMPIAGYTGCASGDYQRKHNPAVNWQGKNLPYDVNQPFSRFSAEFAGLPTVSIIAPNQKNDMHDGEEAEAIARGDAWLKAHLDAYVRWAENNNSLLIVTWDEDDGSEDNRIPTLFIGPMVRPGRYGQRIDHYSLLRTLLDMYGLAPLGESANRQAVDFVWR
jgi:hypothetical protein